MPIEKSRRHRTAAAVQGQENARAVDFLSPHDSVAQRKEVLVSPRLDRRCCSFAAMQALEGGRGAGAELDGKGAVAERVAPLALVVVVQGATVDYRGQAHAARPEASCRDLHSARTGRGQARGSAASGPLVS